MTALIPLRRAPLARGSTTDFPALVAAAGPQAETRFLETFAAVHPRNNSKLAANLAKLADRPETHRYVFFMSPRHPGAQRQPALERAGVQVWSVDV